MKKVKVTKNLSLLPSTVRKANKLMKPLRQDSISDVVDIAVEEAYEAYIENQTVTPDENSTSPRNAK